MEMKNGNEEEENGDNKWMKKKMVMIRWIEAKIVIINE